MRKGRGHVPPHADCTADPKFNPRARRERAVRAHTHGYQRELGGQRRSRVDLDTDTAARRLQRRHRRLPVHVDAAAHQRVTDEGAERRVDGGQDVGSLLDDAHSQPSLHERLGHLEKLG